MFETSALVAFELKFLFAHCFNKSSGDKVLSSKGVRGIRSREDSRRKYRKTIKLHLAVHLVLRKTMQDEQTNKQTEQQKRFFYQLLCVAYIESSFLALTLVGREGRVNLSYSPFFFFGWEPSSL